LGSSASKVKYRLSHFQWHFHQVRRLHFVSALKRAIFRFLPFFFFLCRRPGTGLGFALDGAKNHGCVACWWGGRMGYHPTAKWLPPPSGGGAQSGVLFSCPLPSFSRRGRVGMCEESPQEFNKESRVKMIAITGSPAQGRVR